MVGIASILLAAPNGTVVKSAIDDVNPFLFNTVRFGLIALVTLPFLLIKLHKINKRNLKYTLIVGCSMLIAVLSFIWAIRLSQASYVAIMTLLTPIVFIIFSSKLTGEKISTNAKIGITLAALGAFIIVALPIAIAQQGEFTFYPAATALALTNSLTFPLAIIYSKKANDAGLPLVSVLSISSILIALVCFSIVSIIAVPFEQISQPSALRAVIYSSLAVALLARALNIASYEHIGSAVSSALNYAETLFSIIIPIIVLGETLSIEVVAGGALILLGVYVAEHHKSKHHKHFHMLRHH